MTPPEKKDRARGPESAFWDTLKGQRIVVAPLVAGEGAGRERVLVARLLWVDRFTIGVDDEVEGRPPRMIFKQAIAWVRLDTDE
jgi:hypothetical protein